MELNNLNTPSQDKEPKQEKLARSIDYKEKPNFWWETTKFALIVLFIVIPVRMYVVQPFIVDGQSMEHTFESGQYLLVDELSYRWSNPERGDVIVFHYPKNTKLYFIKRIIGLPGDTIELTQDHVTIKNTDNPNGIVLKDDFLSPDLLNNLLNNYPNHFTVSEGQYFVMGDNRSHSSDSRVWGLLDKKLIVGRPIIRLFEIKSTKASWFPVGFISPKNMGLYPGEHREMDDK